jgi:hypothetical protein
MPFSIAPFEVEYNLSGYVSELRPRKTTSSQKHYPSPARHSIPLQLYGSPSSSSSFNSNNNSTNHGRPHGDCPVGAFAHGPFSEPRC